MTVRGKGDLTEKKAEYPFVLADQSCAVQVTLWAKLAETQAVRLETAYENAEEGILPRVKLVNAEVASVATHGLRAVAKLQSPEGYLNLGVLVGKFVGLIAHSG